MVSVLPPPAVSLPTKRKVYTPSFRPLLATSGISPLTSPDRMSPFSLSTLGSWGTRIQLCRIKKAAMIIREMITAPCSRR